MSHVQHMKLSYISNWSETMQNAAMVDEIFYCYIWPITPSHSISDHIKVQLSLEHFPRTPSSSKFCMLECALHTANYLAMHTSSGT